MEGSDVEDVQEEMVASSAEPTQISGFTQQVYEAAESAVGAEGPLNKTESEPIVAHEYPGAEGTLSVQEIMTHQRDLSREESEESTEASALPCETERSKVQQAFFTDGVRNFCQSPTTWRVIKGLIVLAVAIKLFQSLDTIERYIPLDISGMKSLFGRR